MQLLFIGNLRVKHTKADIIDYEASSFLKEGDLQYIPENLASIDGLPWVSANGYEINDTITLTLYTTTAPKLLIYNGFQSIEKQDLYSKNSRANNN